MPLYTNPLDYTTEEVRRRFSEEEARRALGEAQDRRGSFRGPLDIRPPGPLAPGRFTPMRASPSAQPTLAPLQGGLARLAEDGSGDAPGAVSPSGFASAPAITNSSPVSLGGMIAQGITGRTPSGFTSGLTNLGLGLGQAALGIPTLAISGPVLALGLLTQLAHRMGLQGMDTAPQLSEAQLTAMNQGVPTTEAAQAARIQGLGITPAQLEAINAFAPFGRGGENPAPPEGPPPQGLDLTDALSGPPGGLGDPSDTSGNMGEGLGEPGDPSGVFRRGGTVRRTGPARVHRGEEVIRESEARKVRPALKNINRPGVSGLERLLMEAR